MRRSLLALAVLTAACSPAAIDTTVVTGPPPPSTLPPATVAPPTSLVPPTTVWTPPLHRITIRDGGFVERATGEPFVVRGVNYFLITGGADRFFAPAVYDAARIDADFSLLASKGYNTVRLFLDTCSSGAGCIGNVSGPGLNPDFLDVIAAVMDQAKRHGLVLLLTSNDLPDDGGYREISARDDSEEFPGYRNSDFLTSSGHEAMRLYWNDLLSGLVEREAAFDAVLGWSILNEQWLFKKQPPLSLRDGFVTTAAGTYDLSQVDGDRAMVAETIQALIAGVAGVIRSHDPDALVTMGFFAPQFPNPTGIGGDWFVETAPLVFDSDLDFFDFHAYAGEDITIEEMAENFGIDDRKPVVMGEVGAFVHRYPSVEAGGLAVQHWIADSCAVGFDGWIYWGYLRAPLSDATYALTDSDNYLLEALAPVNQPDPCVPTLVDPNLARSATVIASRSLPGEPPEAAVDGSIDRQWGAGAGPTQWIELQFSGVDVGSIRLTVAQFPEGVTNHRLDFTTSTGTVTRSFGGNTADLDVLEMTFPTALTGVTAIRITTTASPSWVAWREIEVFAG